MGNFISDLKVKSNNVRIKNNKIRSVYVIRIKCYNLRPDESNIDFASFILDEEKKST